MCGIVGYVGSQEAEAILVSGLQKLEYRGYDSAGLAFVKSGDFHVVRAEGKLVNLIEKLKTETTQSSSGIGHTRWATHGKPSEENAHPHYSDDVVLVHNGIIENYLPLKTDLLNKGFTFSSETDTEVICHLIQNHLNGGNDFISSFRLAMNEIEGAFALVVMHKDEPGKILVAKKGSPLVVGLGQGENFVASDIPALLAYTKEVVFFDDFEMAVITSDKVDYMDFEGQSLEKDSHQITWTAAQAEKGGYKHFMLKEIMEQPRALADTVLGRLDREHNLVSFDKTDLLLEKFIQSESPQIQIVACGTSWHSGLVAKYWIEKLAKIPTSVELASEFRYRHPILNENTLMIPISQSGETADTLAALKESKKMGPSILSICNVIESSIPRSSDATLYTYAGPEIGVASTKAFLTQMSVLYLLALKLAELSKVISSHEIAERVEAMVALPNQMEDFLHELPIEMEKLSEEIYQRKSFYFLGRGLQFPIVLEGALKLKEVSYIHAEGYAGGEMKHGPIALIEDGVPVFAIALKDSLRDKMVANIEEIEARGGEAFALISEGDEELAKKFPNHISIPNTHEELMPFLTIVPLQLLAYYVADHKGTDVDQPRNLAKSVTVE